MSLVFSNKLFLGQKSIKYNTGVLNSFPDLCHRQAVPPGKTYVISVSSGVKEVFSLLQNYDDACMSVSKRLHKCADITEILE